MMIPLLWCRGYQWSETSCWGAGKFAPSLGIGAPCEYHPLQPCCWFWISTPTQASSKQREIDRPKGDGYPFTGGSAGIGSTYKELVQHIYIYIYIYCFWLARLNDVRYIYIFHPYFAIDDVRRRHWLFCRYWSLWRLWLPGGWQQVFDKLED